uniref:MULE domain-containing protein n=1 Tax=Heterorhabditis bacteriophora TaxID=37862 RepID=A0A1I7X8F6_HETBA
MGMPEEMLPILMRLMQQMGVQAPSTGAQSMQMDDNLRQEEKFNQQVHGIWGSGQAVINQQLTTQVSQKNHTQAYGQPPLQTVVQNSSQEFYSAVVARQSSKSSGDHATKTTLLSRRTQGLKSPNATTSPTQAARQSMDQSNTSNFFSFFFLKLGQSIHSYECENFTKYNFSVFNMTILDTSKSSPTSRSSVGPVITRSMLPDIPMPLCSLTDSWSRLLQRLLHNKQLSLLSANRSQVILDFEETDYKSPEVYSQNDSTTQRDEIKEESEQVMARTNNCASPTTPWSDEDIELISVVDEVESPSLHPWLDQVAPMSDVELAYVERAFRDCHILDIYREPSLRFVAMPPVCFVTPRISELLSACSVIRRTYDEITLFTLMKHSLRNNICISAVSKISERCVGIRRYIVDELTYCFQEKVATIASLLHPCPSNKNNETVRTLVILICDSTLFTFVGLPIVTTIDSISRYDYLDSVRSLVNCIEPKVITLLLVLKKDATCWQGRVVAVFVFSSTPASPVVACSSKSGEKTDRVSGILIVLYYNLSSSVCSPSSSKEAPSFAAATTANLSPSLSTSISTPPCPPPSGPVSSSGQFEVSKMDVSFFLFEFSPFTLFINYLFIYIYIYIYIYMYIKSTLDQKTDAVVVLNMILSTLQQIEWVYLGFFFIQFSSFFKVNFSRAMVFATSYEGSRTASATSLGTTPVLNNTSTRLSIMGSGSASSLSTAHSGASSSASSTSGEEQDHDR